MMELTIRQLEIFVTTARLEHATGAGEALGLTQPAVSLALAGIERQCHGPLFRRVGRKLMLNDRGRLLLPEAEAVLGRMRLLYERMESRKGDPAGILRLGASTTIGNYLLPAIIGAFTRRRPRAQIELMVGNTHQVEEGVESGHLDLGFIEGPGHRSGLLLTPWRDDELVVIVSPRHPWSRRAAVKKKELGKAAWLARERGSGTREVFERAMAEAGLKPRMKLELGHTEAIKQATVANLGIACLSRLAVAGDIEAGRLVEVATELDLTRSLSLVTRPESDRTPLLEEFSAFLTGKHTR
ncbi:MAG TPA: LysR family transcriptional regulator [Candidatus Ozemobacteraceae bacterium]